jgi:hypothetical protein
VTASLIVDRENAADSLFTINYINNQGTIDWTTGRG